MKAAVYMKYGPPEVVQIAEIDKPIPKENEVLVKVYASTVNRTEAGFRSAEYVVSRFWSGIFKPKFHVLGCEFAGIIESLGANVSQFKVGDKVFGYDDEKFGGHAEYICVAENSAITTIPKGYNFMDAAPLSEGSHYALNNIRAAKVKAGQHVLVYGATGAIGSAAVQLLKHFGAHVTAVCGTLQVDLVKRLGADAVVDYQTQDFTKTETKFDFVFDAVGKSSFGQCKPLMTSKGIYISTELGKGGENIFFALFTPLWGGKKVLFPIPVMDKGIIEFIRDLAENGEFKPVIDRNYSLDQIVEAYKYVETGQKIGNVVLIVADKDYF
jgi:NADPH:quinone reductase-like Zn-dependent oxidoreductase